MPSEGNSCVEYGPYGVVFEWVLGVADEPKIAQKYSTLSHFSPLLGQKDPFCVVETRTYFCAAARSRRKEMSGWEGFLSVRSCWTMSMTKRQCERDDALFASVARVVLCLLASLKCL